jgi:hypothetical protein
MSTDDRSRLELHTALETALGRDPADTLMGHLPPRGWGDVATVRDLEILEARIDHKLIAFEARLDQRFAQIDYRFAEIEARFAQVEARFAQVEARFAQVEARFERALRVAVLAICSTIITAVGVSVGLVGLLG